MVFLVPGPRMAGDTSGAVEGKPIFEVHRCSGVGGSGDLRAKFPSIVPDLKSKDHIAAYLTRVGSEASTETVVVKGIHMKQKLGDQHHHIDDEGREER